MIRRLKVEFYKHINLSTFDIGSQIRGLLWEDTYKTNAIEGSKLGENETLLLIDNPDSSVFKGQSKRDIAYVHGYKRALDYIFQCLRGNVEVTELFIQELHYNLMFYAMGLDAGEYRNFDVEVMKGVKAIPFTHHRHLKKEMSEVVERYRKYKDTEHPIDLACNLKCDFIVVHPFADGNGRTSRLLLQYVLMKNKYLPVTIEVEEKEEYIEYMDIFRRTGNNSKYINMVERKLLERYTNPPYP